MENFHYEDCGLYTELGKENVVYLPSTLIRLRCHKLLINGSVVQLAKKTHLYCFRHVE
jgi:hypothetical protein